MVGTKNFEMPNTCDDCRYCIPYCIHTAKSDNDYYCKALDRFMKYDEVDGGVNILRKPSDCPLIEAISRDQYEARLKAEKVAMLEDVKSEIEELPMYYDPLDIGDLIQQKINSLKENTDDN